MEFVAQRVDLGSLIGLRLKSLSRGDLTIDGEEDAEDLGPLELVFDSGTTPEIRLGPDGESIELRVMAARPSELLGKADYWARIELLGKEEFKAFDNEKIVGIDAILFGSHPEGSECLAGLVFRFGQNSLADYNAGNFSKIYVNDYPPSLSEPFYLRLENAASFS